MTSFALRHYQHATPPVSALRIMTRHDLWRMSILGATPSMLRGNAADDYVVRSGNLRCLRSHVPDNILWKSDILNLKANKRQSTGCVNARSCSKQQREGQHCTWKRCRKRPSQQTRGKSYHTEMFEGCDFLLPQTTCTSIFSSTPIERTLPSHVVATFEANSGSKTSACSLSRSTTLIPCLHPCQSYTVCHNL